MLLGPVFILAAGHTGDGSPSRASDGISKKARRTADRKRLCHRIVLVLRVRLNGGYNDGSAGLQTDSETRRRVEADPVGLVELTRGSRSRIAAVVSSSPPRTGKRFRVPDKKRESHEELLLHCSGTRNVSRPESRSPFRWECLIGMPHC
jgi:hypothetical protein